MGIKGSVLHDNVLGNADTERGEVPYGLDTTLYHGIRYLLGYFDRYRQHAYIDIVLLHLLTMLMKNSCVSCTSKPATISKPKWLRPESRSKAPPKLPTPNRNALCILVNPRKSSSTAISVSTSYPTRVRPEILTYERSLAICEASILISLEIWVDDTNRSPFCFSNFTLERYHGSRRKVGSGTFVESFFHGFFFL